ncbi:MAG: hypothetical protein F6K58_22245, partial [Symploca sp. SIO2E9]|nr:hypothetical protein [Symploca sp. SIO2E9]
PLLPFTTLFRSPSASCLLPSAFCLLPPASCLLPSASCLLPSAFCLLPLVGRGGEDSLRHISK